MRLANGLLHHHLQGYATTELTPNSFRFAIVRPDMNSPKVRPKIGLALGSGVARGWAHIGALRALTRAGYMPDVICGTSMGALVGGFYLAGHLDELEEWARALNKRKMIMFLNVMTRGAGGLISGPRLEKLLREYIDDTLIEDLDRPFAAVTTELATGHEIWLQKGCLVDAIRASYALPGVFPPVKDDQRWLIDGALVNPVPVSTCRALGARLVIGVTLNYDAFGKTNIHAQGTAQDSNRTVFSESRYSIKARSPRKDTADRTIMRQLFGNGSNAPGVGSVMLSSLNIIMDRLSRARMAGDPADVMVSPRVGHISLLEFDKADELIGLGEEAMEEMIPHLDEAIEILSY